MADARKNTIGDELMAVLPQSPDACLQKIDLAGGNALVIRFSQDAYRAASFLDDRILGPSTQGAWLPGARVSEAARQVASPRPLHFIFHTGHVGSTLVSRLLDETGAVLSLREPLPLRTVADAHDVLGQPESLLSEAQFGALLDMALRLWSRGYESTRAVVVKATSSAGRAAIPLLEARSEARAVYLNVRPEPYLGTLLAGENSPDDLRGHGPGRIRRLQARCSTALAPLHSLSIGELAALGWLVETASLRDVLQRFPDRVRAIDFDSFLASVGDTMAGILAHFGLPQDSRFLAGIGTSPVLKRYSKSPDQPFTPDDRATLLSESRRHNRDEIARGMAWLERLARAEPALAAVVNDAGAS